jgi:hypothetical protein
VTASGALYFASARDNGYGQGDLYRAAARGDGFASPEILGLSVNSSTGEWNLWVSASDYDLVFEASSRPSNVSIPGDLYYSWRTPAGWTAATPLKSLNTRGSELLPRLHPDGETLYYTTALSGGHAAVVATDWKALREDTRNNYAPTLLVANRSSHDVSFVDLARGEVIAATGTGEGPHLLSNVSDGRVLATGYGEFPQPHGMPVESRPSVRPILRILLRASNVEIDLLRRWNLRSRRQGISAGINWPATTPRRPSTSPRRGCGVRISNRQRR